MGDQLWSAIERGWSFTLLELASSKALLYAVRCRQSWSSCRRRATRQDEDVTASDEHEQAFVCGHGLVRGHQIQQVQFLEYWILDRSSSLKTTKCRKTCKWIVLLQISGSRIYVTKHQALLCAVTRQLRNIDGYAEWSEPTVELRLLDAVDICW
jgi:hypothetical protein